MSTMMKRGLMGVMIISLVHPFEDIYHYSKADWPDNVVSFHFPLRRPWFFQKIPDRLRQPPHPGGSVHPLRYLAKRDDRYVSCLGRVWKGRRFGKKTGPCGEHEPGCEKIT